MTPERVTASLREVGTGREVWRGTVYVTDQGYVPVAPTYTVWRRSLYWVRLPR